MDRYILSMKWGSLYDATYVNVLYRAAMAHSIVKPKFVCFTDNPEGLLPEIIARPIPDYAIPDARWKSGAWPKLTVFAPELDEFQGRALFIDLDMVILSDLDPFFEAEGGVVMIDGSENWKKRANVGPVSPMSSIFAFDIGSQAKMFDRYVADQDAVYAEFRLEQDYLGAAAEDVRFWPLDWVSSFKWHQRRPPLVDRVLLPKDPAPETKVLVFHGDPRPVDLLENNWAKAPRFGKGPVPWMQDYWARFNQ